MAPRRAPRPIRLPVLLAAVGLCAACREPLPFEPAGPGVVPDPSTFGPYAVGVRTLTLTAPPREPGKPARTLVTEVWYPAAESTRGQEGARYPFRDFLPERTIAALGGVDLGAIETVAVRDAPPRTDDAPYPLVLFSHGSGGVRVQSTYLTVPLASHGYVVVAPDHQGNTLREVLAADRIDFGGMLESFLDRTRDLSFLIDRMTTLGEDDVLFGLSDAERVGAAGHSFGAVTAIRMPALDRRVKAAVPQAPAGYTAAWLEVERPLEEVGVPIMIQAGGLDRTTPAKDHAESFWPHLRSPRWYVNLRRGGHFTFSDLCGVDREKLMMVEDLGVGNALEDGCGPMNVPATAAFPLIRHFAIGAFNGYLRGSSESVALLVEAEGARIAGADELVVRSEP